MKCDIILAGVGGQGILTIATIIGKAALKSNMNVKQAEVHGMSQRGGDVQSDLRISTEEIFSDLIPKGEADVIVSMEPMEALRYLPRLSPKGWIVTNTAPFINVPEYPEKDSVHAELSKLPHVIALDIDESAKSLGAPRSANIVLLGALTPFIRLPKEALEDAVADHFARKGQDVVAQNIAAFRYGYEIAEKNS
ncbi:MAG: indolepyruvate oxidoreductase subunit beta [Muribaculaceae bacterium]|nr:indolepyruvate oxidoreductase subunit beta [Muribaculaceae bacterium]